MPTLIEEVVIEVEPGVTTPGEAEPLHLLSPVATAEAEILRTLALIRERQERLEVD